MSNADRLAPGAHRDEVLFREAVAFTAAQTGFSQRLIEKDYFCTVLLVHLASASDSPLVFKGGTCLAKIHADFYRMSEDLDFVVPVRPDCGRSERRRHASVLKKLVSAISKAEPALSVAKPLRGANLSRQYLGTIGYASLVEDRDDTIKIEVGIREPLMTKIVRGPARTALLDPVSGGPLVPPVAVSCISFAEAFAEKARAALTRREVAIRDFYDVDHGVTRLGLDPIENAFVNLVREKLAIPGNEPVDVSDSRMASLEAQLMTRLRPVLRQHDFDRFNLDRAINTVLQIAEALAGL